MSEPQGQEPRLRVATHDDVSQLLAFWAVAAENDGRPADDRQDVTVLLARDPAALLIAEAGGSVVGTLICGWDGWRFHLYRLAVHPDWRGRGVARLLIAEAERRASEVGAKRIDALVLSHNELGVHFWEAAGYRRQDDWRRWVRQLR